MRSESCGSVRPVGASAPSWSLGGLPHGTPLDGECGWAQMLPLIVSPSPSRRQQPRDAGQPEVCPGHLQVLVQAGDLPGAGHHAPEGQGARSLHYPRQPLLPGSLRAGHESGLSSAHHPAAEQERRSDQRAGETLPDRDQPAGGEAKGLPQRAQLRLFGFVARKQGSTTDNVCHLFAELDPDQPATAIVNFVSRVMLGSGQKR
uniref:PTB domain-containing protein n=1 Tax=Pelodiscus sinensis TaxID=13735 RepID=K7G3W3_PELSI